FDPDELSAALAELGRVLFPEDFDEDEELKVARLAVRLLEWEKALEASRKQNAPLPVEIAHARAAVARSAPLACKVMSRWEDGG
ncbi:hypothetical protein OFC00_31535, partial [Escherichia coli]|nr:hypothetical protein [Escherichia coli]